MTFGKILWRQFLFFRGQVTLAVAEKFWRAAGFGKNSSILTTTYYLNYWESLLRSACAGGSTQTQIVDKLDYKYMAELRCIFLSS